MSRGQRRVVIAALIAVGLAIGAYIALHDDAEFRASALSWIALLSYGLGALVCGLRAVIAFRERESWWMKAGMIVLACILGGLFYDAVA
jgi:hypothetical protein